MIIFEGKLWRNLIYHTQNIYRNVSVVFLWLTDGKCLICLSRVPPAGFMVKSTARDKKEIEGSARLVSEAAQWQGTARWLSSVVGPRWAGVCTAPRRSVLGGCQVIVLGGSWSRAIWKKKKRKEKENIKVLFFESSGEGIVLVQDVADGFVHAVTTDDGHPQEAGHRHGHHQLPWPAFQQHRVRWHRHVHRRPRAVAAE